MLAQAPVLTTSETLKSQGRGIEFGHRDLFFVKVSAASSCAAVIGCYFFWLSFVVLSAAIAARVLRHWRVRVRLGTNR